MAKLIFQSPWGKTEHDPVLRGEPWGPWADVLEPHAPELAEQLDLSDHRTFEWGLIGDNSLCAHVWATKMEGLGVPKQAALRYVRDRFVPDGTQ